MTEVRNIFTDTEGLELHELHARKQAILDSAAGNYRDLSDDLLAELVAITRALRRKAATPGRPGAKRLASTKKPASLSDLA